MLLLNNGMPKLTFRADGDLVRKLEEFDESKSEVIREALESFLEEDYAPSGIMSYSELEDFLTYDKVFDAGVYSGEKWICMYAGQRISEIDEVLADEYAERVVLLEEAGYW